MKSVLWFFVIEMTFTSIKFTFLGVVLGVEPRAWSMLGKHSATEPCSPTLITESLL